MVQQVTIPLSELNNLPGVAGVQDVEFDIPELDDIVNAIVANTLDRTDIDEVIRDAIDDIPDVDIPDVPSVDEIADEVADRLDFSELGGITVDIEGSLFDIEQDLVDLLEALLRELDLEDLFPTVDLGPISDAVEDVLAAVEDIDVPTIDDIQQIIEDALAAVEPTVDAVGLFDNPVAFAIAVATEAVSDAVGSATADELAETVDRTTQRLEETGVRDGP